MINIRKSGNIITISGHSKQGFYGNDIVCASVSSIIYTTINGILNFDNKAIKVIDNEKIMKIEILKETREVEILINNMFELLNELIIKYPKNIKISKGE